jgi:hypothetical protein
MSWVADKVSDHVGDLKETFIDPLTGKTQADAAKAAGRAERAAADRAMEEQRLAREQFIERTEPFRQVGLQAANPLQQFVLGGGQDAQTLAQVNPLVDFMRQEGFRDIEERAAARGKLGSGGTLRDLARFNTQLTSTVVPQLQQQRYNQLFGLFSQGGALGTGQGQAGIQTAGNVGRFDVLGAQGYGSGLQGAADAKAQGMRNVVKLGSSLLGLGGE